MSVYDELMDEDQAQQPAAPGPTKNVYDSMMDADARGQETHLKAVSVKAMETLPDRAAESRRISATTGQPVELVERNFDQFVKQDKIAATPFAEIAKQTPHLAAFMKESNNAAIVQDDLENLGLLEWLVTAPQRAFARGMHQIEVGRLRTASMSRSLTQEENDQLSSAKYHMEQGAGLGVGDSWFKGAVSGTAGLLPNLFGAGMKTAEYSSLAIPVTVGLGMAAGAVLAAPVSAATLFGAGLTVGGMAGGLHFGFELEAGLAYDEFLTHKDEMGRTIDPGAAKVAAIGAGVLNAGLEATGLGILARRFPGIEKLTGGLGRAAVKQALRSPSVRSALTHMAKDYAGDLAAETGVEVAQRAITVMGGELAKASQDIETRPAMKSYGEIGTDLAQEAWGALQSFALLSAPGPAMSVQHNIQRAKQAEQAQGFFQSLATGVKESKTIERQPEVAQAFIARATKDGPIENIYVPTEAWERHWASKGIDPAEVAGELTGDRGAFDEAKRNGEDLVLPTSAYAVKLAGTEHHAGLVEELRLGENAMNMRESKAFLAEQKAIADAEMAATPADLVGDTVIAQLQTALADRGINLPQGAIERGGQAMKQFFATAQEMEGVDAVQMFVDHFAGVLGPDDAKPGTATAPAQATETVNDEPASAAPPTVEELHNAVLEAAGVTQATQATTQAETQGTGIRDQSTTQDLALTQDATTELDSRVSGVPPTERRQATGDTAAAYTGPERRLNPDQAVNLAGGIGAAAASMRNENPNIDRDAQAMKDQATAGGTRAEQAKKLLDQQFPEGSPEREELLEKAKSATLDPEITTLLQEAIERSELQPVAYEFADLRVAPARMVNGRLRLSTRVPWAKTAAAADDVLTTTLDVAKSDVSQKAGVPPYLARASAMIRSVITRLPKLGGDTVPLFPQLTQQEKDTLTDEQLVDRLVDVMSDHLTRLWEMAAPWRDRAKLWYVGAHRISLELADTYGISAAQSAGVLASLSPQMDWFKNVDLAERVIRIFQQAKKADMEMSQSLFDSYATRSISGADSATRGDVASVKAVVDADRAAYLGKRWSEMDSRGQAIMLRTIDEETGTKAYRIITPEGDYGDFVRNQPSKAQLKKGEPGNLASMGWGTYDFIAGAISILTDGSIQNIHIQLGDQHKVRSFFNNISDPDYEGAVTIDTHAVAAALMVPVSGKYAEVEKTMGKGPGAAGAGLSGLNPIIAEAYFKVARDLEVSPREVQSVTWEAVRMLFPDSKKGVPLTRAVDQLWAQRSSGKLSTDEFFSGVLEATGEPRSPDWVDTPARLASDQGELLASNARRDVAGPGGRRSVIEGAQGRPGRLAAGPDQLHRGRWRRRADGSTELEGKTLYQSSRDNVELPPFQSRIIATVEASSLAKASGAQWIATIKNSKLGVNKDELTLTSVEDLDAGTVYTKAEVLEYLATHQVQVSQVVLGGEAGQDYQDRVDEMARELADAARDRNLRDALNNISEPDHDVIIVMEEDENGEPVERYQAVVDGEEIGDLHDSIETAREAALDRAEQIIKELEDEVTEQFDRYNDDFDDTDFQAEARNEIGEPGNATQYEEYSLPYFLDGSYREAFVTAEPIALKPSIIEAVNDAFSAAVQAEGEWRAAVRERTLVVDMVGNERHPTAMAATAKVDQARLAMVQAQHAHAALRTSSPRADWRDGHEAYEDIERPIVRLRFNTRNGSVAVGDDATMHRVMFLEEVQPPQTQNFKLMPALFQKNWRELAMKWALRYAVEHNLTAIAWTTGRQQIERYPGVAQLVDKIEWTTERVGTMKSTADEDLRDVRSVLIHTKNTGGGRPGAVAVDLETGVIQRAPGYDSQWAGKHLESVIGKEIAGRILEGEPQGELAGEGLEIGGQGLQKLYDKDLRNVVQNLPAVKKTGAKVETIDIATARRKQAAHYLRPRSRDFIGKEFLVMLGDQVIATEDAEGFAEFKRFFEKDPDFVVSDRRDQELRKVVNPNPGEHLVISTWDVDNAGVGGRRFASQEQAQAAAQEIASKAAMPQQGIVITQEVKAAVEGGQTLFQGEDKPRGAIHFGPNRKFTIQIFQDADVSTFMHEAAHFFLEMMQELERRPNATARIKNDMRLLRDQFFGPGQEGVISVDQHEWFARAFERYLMEGKAPSLELKGLFNDFRAWLTRFYRTLGSLNVQLTDDVRGVFDRMLATDQQIAAAQADTGATPMFTTAESAGMSEERFAAYQESIGATSLKARETLEAKLLQEVRRTQKAIWRQAENDTREEVTKNVHARPVYQALAAMRSGTRPDGSAIVEGAAGEPLLLSRQIIEARYGADVVAALPRPRIDSIQGGLDPDVVADMFGFSSGDAMLRAVSSAPSMRKAIEAETAQTMRERFGDMVADGKLSDEAKTALANVEREAIVRAELEALGELRLVAAPFVELGQQDVANERAERNYERRWNEAEAKLRIAIAEGHKQVEIDALQDEVLALRRKARGGAATVRAGIPNDDLLRQAADERIGRTRVRDLRPSTFWAAARQASLKAAELAARQDFDGAIIAKQQELINLATFRRASQAVAESEKRVRQAQLLTTPAARARLGRAGQGYLDQVDGILDRYEFARTTNTKLDRRASLVKWVESLKAEGLPADLPESLLNEALRINYRELSVNQLNDVTDGLKQIVHLATLKLGLLKNKQARELAEVVSDVVATIRGSFTGTRASTSSETRLPSERAMRMIDAGFASHRKLGSYVREMDGFADGGAVFDAILQPLNAAADQEAVMNAAATKALSELFETAYPKSQKATLYVKTEIKEVGQSLTKMARLMVALNWGNEGNRDRVRAGEKWNDQQVKAILDTLDRRDWDFVEGVWAYIDTYWTDIAAKSQRVTGLKPEKVEASPFVTKFGEMRGGYFPLKYDDRRTGAAAQNVDAEAAKLQQSAAYAHATTKRGHEQARLENVGSRYKVRLDFGVIFEHVTQVIHDLSHHEALIDVGRVLGHADVQDAIYETYGDIVYKQMKRTVQAVAQGETGQIEAFEQILNHMRVGATVAGLGWNLSTILMQPLGLTQSMQRIGIKWVAKGMHMWLTGDATTKQNTIAWIEAKSSFMKMRGQTQQREINEIRNQVGANTGKLSGWVDEALDNVTLGTVTRAGIADSYFFLIQQTQKIADVPTWLGQYEKSMAAGETEERAIEQADQSVRDAQGGGQTKDLASVQRGSPALKLFTNFYSFFNPTYNLSVESMHQARGMSKPGAVGRLGVDYLLLYAMPATLGWMMREALKGGDDDDDKDFVKNLVVQNAAYLMGSMVGLRELAGSIQGYYGYEGPAGARGFAALSKLGKQVMQGELDAAALSALNDTAGILFHYPSGQVKRTLQGVVALIEGKTTNPGVLVVGPPREK